MQKGAFSPAVERVQVGITFYGAEAAFNPFCLDSLLLSCGVL